VTAVIIIVVLVVGLPALAWWVARRPFWTTHRARLDQDFWLEIIRAHHLDPVEIRSVAAARAWGSRLPEPHLRRAAVDWAQRDLERIEGNRSAPSVLRRRAVAGGLAAVLVVLGLLAGRWVSGASSEGDLVVLAVLATLVIGAWAAEPIEQANLRRLIRRNSETRRC